MRTAVTFDVRGFVDFTHEVRSRDGKRREPFPWQCALAEQVLAEGWPDVIDVPTGLGKTFVLDLAVFALAADAAAGELRRARTRTFLVVDRRVIVDSAYRYAEAIRDALTGPGDRRTVAEVAAALRTLSGPAPAAPLDVVRMRGGVTWDWRWARGPDQPLIITGTVDQFGSRLLFRGYGVSYNLRPLDAALTGNDALVVVDEAHLSRPLLGTTDGIRVHESRAVSPPLPHRPVHVVRLSATAPDDGGTTFSADLARELEHDESARRLRASKRATLVSLPSVRGARSGAAGAAGVAESFADAVAAVVRRLLDASSPQVVGVVVNTVRMARAVHTRLGEVESVLLTGRCRQYDRDRLLDEHWDDLRVGRGRSRAETLVVVATQTIEVGADLDFDALVTEAAPLDALVQRFGRVDRVGALGTTRSVIVHAPFRHGDDNPVYGAAVARTWDLLVDLAGGVVDVPKTSMLEFVDLDAPFVDFGTLALAEAVPRPMRAALDAEPVTAPVVLGPTVRAWACTSPVPLPDQPVAPYLHGVQRGEDEISVCWRVDRSEAGLRALWPTGEEFVSVPLRELRSLLASTPPGDTLSDYEGVPAAADDEDDAAVGARAVVLEGGNVRPVAWATEVRPGALVVLDPTCGGHDQFGWTGDEGTPTADVGDLVPRAGRQCLRLHAGSLASLLPAAAHEVIDSIVGEAWNAYTTAELPHDAIVREALGALLPLCTGDGPYVAVLRTHIETLQGAVHRSADRLVRAEDGQSLLVSVHRSEEDGGPTNPAVAMDECSDDDEASSSCTTVVALDAHLAAVGERAAAIAERLGLASPLVEAVRLAGEAHDLGKADVRFQAMLRGGDRLAAEAASELLAKSGRRRSPRGDWPKGMRHEAISGALLQRMVAEHAERFATVDTELLVHLVTTHHGRGRPLLPPVHDPGHQAVTAALPDGPSATVTGDHSWVDWDGPARFDRLCRRYGAWGLALLEAVVRLADIGCSEEGR